MLWGGEVILLFWLGSCHLLTKCMKMYISANELYRKHIHGLTSWLSKVTEDFVEELAYHLDLEGSVSLDRCREDRQQKVMICVED